MCIYYTSAQQLIKKSYEVKKSTKALKTREQIGYTCILPNTYNRCEYESFGATAVAKASSY